MNRNASAREVGFTLFEICIAIAMIAIGFLAVLAVLSAGIQQAYTAKANFTAPFAARSAGDYCMAVGAVPASGKLGGAAITPTSVGGYIPDRPDPAPTFVNVENAIPFSQYVMKISERDLGNDLKELLVTCYENEMDMDANRNPVGTYRLRVYLP